MPTVNPSRGTDNGLGTASSGSNRDVAISDDHELRHDDDRVHKWQSELGHPPADETYLGCENMRAGAATERSIHDHRIRPVEFVFARGGQSHSRNHRDNTSDVFATSTARVGVDETTLAKAEKETADWTDPRRDKTKGTESQIDDVAKIERDKADEAKTDAVAENKTGEVPQECDSKTNVEMIDRGSTADAAGSAAQQQYVRRWNECFTTC